MPAATTTSSTRSRRKIITAFRRSSPESTRPSEATTPTPWSTDAAPAQARTQGDRAGDPELAAWLKAELAALPPQALVFAAASDFAPDASHKPPGKPRPVHVLKRGDIHQPGKPAVPGTLSCVDGLPARFSVAAGDDESARRAALARWITDPRNPLTWRSIVNRVWH